MSIYSLNQMPVNLKTLNPAAVKPEPSDLNPKP